jgi:protocatechuate 3,4-dioxygenase beta subunit
MTPRSKRLITPGDLLLARRHLLEGLGALGIGSYLAGCSSDDDAANPALDRAEAGSSGSGGNEVGSSGSAGGEAGSSGSGGAQAGSSGSGGAVDEATCTLTPEQTEGPFFVETGLVRSDIREGRAGTELRLALRVVDADGCSPIAAAIVQVWHADAAGAYSAFDTSQGNSADTLGETFLRGFQTTDAEGRVDFVTIYPGWYPGRTPHIHLMVQIGERNLLTTQLYFPEGVTDEVYEQAPYNARGTRTTTNASDGVGGVPALIGNVSESAGAYATAFRLVVPRA